MNPLLIATRSTHKLREIRQILGPIPNWEIVDLGKLGIPPSHDEDEIEVHATFEENAAAKARYFVERTGGHVLADDSGLAVDALRGAPGVRSRRFSGRNDLSGPDLDHANNLELLAALRGVPSPRRTAHYVCAVALASPGGRCDLLRGRCDGLILEAPRGSGGFGYDPLFFLPDESATFGQLPAERKNLLSHRARALRLARDLLLHGWPASPPASR